MSRPFVEHPLLARYDALVAGGALERDPSQEALLRKLESLSRALEEDERPPPASPLAFLTRVLPRRAPRGLYIHGDVGRGKTMLMDMFFETLMVERKRRAHFHDFMFDAHMRLHRARRGSEPEPVAIVAAQIATETKVLCFDEFAVNDIADATILARLFAGLLDAGVVVVATSNVEPGRLYEGGRNRDQFTPFIALLQRRLETFRLQARADFRLEKLHGGRLYFTPLGKKTTAAMDALFSVLAHGAPPARATLRVKGREIVAPRASGLVARFAFEEICGRPLGAADYAAFAARFDSIMVDDVPILDFERRNEAKRFITLIDVLYDARVKLIVSAAAEPHELYRAEAGFESIEFRRAASRLVEMRSGEWMEHKRARSAGAYP